MLENDIASWGLKGCEQMSHRRFRFGSISGANWLCTGIILLASTSMICADEPRANLNPPSLGRLTAHPLVPSSIPAFQILVPEFCGSSRTASLTVNDEPITVGQDSWIQLETIPAICRLSYVDNDRKFERKFLAMPNYRYDWSLTAAQFSKEADSKEVPVTISPAPSEYEASSREDFQNKIRDLAAIQVQIENFESHLAELRRELSELADLDQLNDKIMGMTKLRDEAANLFRDRQNTLEKENNAKNQEEKLIHSGQVEINRCDESLKHLATFIGNDGGLDAAVHAINRSLKQRRDAVQGEMEKHQSQAAAHGVQVLNLQRLEGDAHQKFEKLESDRTKLESERDYIQGHTKSLKSQIMIAERELDRHRRGLKGLIFDLHGRSDSMP